MSEIFDSETTRLLRAVRAGRITNEEQRKEIIWEALQELRRILRRCTEAWKEMYGNEHDP